MGIRLRFIKDESADGIEVIVRAKERDDETNHIIDLLGGETSDVLVCKSLTEDAAIAPKDVVIISKNGRFLSVKTTNREYVLSEPLYKLEERLDKTQFVRISQSEIVNLQHVEKWSFDGGGIIRIEMVNGITSYTSRRYAGQIRKILKKGGRKA